MRKSFMVWGAGLLFLGGCASVPVPLQGQFSEVSPLQASETQTRDIAVRWGGDIIAVHPEAGRTCLEVLARRLGDSTRPIEVDRSAGRFLACRGGFYDPAIFTEGRQVTVTGVLGGYEQRHVGEYEYTYPRVEADVIYLWPIRYYVDRYDPWYWGWPHYGPYYGPFSWGIHYYRPIRPHRPHRPRRSQG